jgi:hypothetical protein
MWNGASGNTQYARKAPQMCTSLLLVPHLVDPGIFLPALALCHHISTPATHHTPQVHLYTLRPEQQYINPILNNQTQVRCNRRNHPDLLWHPAKMSLWSLSCYHVRLLHIISSYAASPRAV